MIMYTYMIPLVTQQLPNYITIYIYTCESYVCVYIYLGLPTPKKYQSFCTIRRFIRFMVVSLGVVCHGCVSHRHDPPPSLLTNILLSKYGTAHPSWFLLNCALPKLYKFTRFLDLRAFCG